MCSVLCSDTTVFPSFQAIPIGTQDIVISGENFASDFSRIKVKCMDSLDRIIGCNCTWVDSETGRQAKIEFSKPLEQKHTGKIYLRLDSDDNGWLKPVEVAVVIDIINPWPSVTIITTILLFGTVPTTICCLYWRIKLNIGENKFQKRRKKMEKAKLSKLPADLAMQHQFHGLH